MQPVSCDISYTVAGEPFAIALVLQPGQVATRTTAHVTVDVSCVANVVHVEMVPHVALQVQSCEVALHHAFTSDDRVLVNGYQSWTTTTELPPDAFIRKPHRLLRAIVDHWALDASGDYRFVEYGQESGQLHGFTYATVRRHNTVTLVASLDESQGFTLVRFNTQAAEVSIQREVPAECVPPESKVDLCRFCILEGTEDTVFDTWADMGSWQVRPMQPLCGYSSWYRHFEHITEEMLRTDLAGAAQAFAHLDTTGFTRVFQVDDGWCKKGDWLDVCVDAFPQGLAPLASAIAQAGFVPGLWMAPFVAQRDSYLATQHPDWLLHDKAGNVVVSGSHWGGHVALDTCNPQVRSYIASCVRQATQDWGFKLLKLDFLYAACMVPHAGMNRGQLMADAIELLREAAGSDIVLLACGVPLASAFGVADVCRIGCDVGLDWDDAVYMRALHRERISTKNSLGNTVYRAPLDGRMFANDPDVVFLRSDVRLTASQRQMLLDAAALFGSVLFTSDNMGQWPAEATVAFQEALDTMRARKGESLHPASLCLQ